MALKPVGIFALELRKDIDIRFAKGIAPVAPAPDQFSVFFLPHARETIISSRKLVVQQLDLSPSGLGR